MWFWGVPGEDGVFTIGPVTHHAEIPAFKVVPLWKRRHTNRLPYRPETTRLLRASWKFAGLVRLGSE